VAATPVTSAASVAAVEPTLAAPVAAPPAAAAPAAAEGAGGKAMNDENTTLKDKIQYLESRLMEYEIVQEEISALGQLREQNDQMRSQLEKLGVKPEVGDAPPVAGSSGPAVDTLPTTTPASEATAAAPVAPQAAGAPGPANQANPVTEAVSNDQIDSILSQLDNITEKPTGS
ncbi:hypothetical protein K2X33_01000, partial [bacterium]|nr:hypothetical protein [bacterium]